VDVELLNGVLIRDVVALVAVDAAAADDVSAIQAQKI